MVGPAGREDGGAGPGSRRRDLKAGFLTGPQRRSAMYRPAPATVISLIALFFAMSGTAYAATGGDFILGKANTATSVSSLTNKKGTALSLSSSSTTPPLKVS